MIHRVRSAVILTKTSYESAVQIVGQSLETLVQQFDFGFRGFGVGLRLFFERGRLDEERIDEPLPQKDFAVDTAWRLARRYRWFALRGSIRAPGVNQLLSMGAVLYPTGDPEHPATAVFQLDSWFHARVLAPEVDRDAADLLLRLSTILGANPLADGFATELLPALSEARVPDGAFLRRALLAPDPPAEPFDPEPDRRSCRPGLVTGVKRTLAPRAEVERKWPRGIVLGTATGFTVLSTMIEAPLGLLESVVFGR
jgi:hypothetical protein